MGIVLFWMQYIIAAISLYHITRCLYVKGNVDKSIYSPRYYKTDNDKRLKHSLWMLIIFFGVLLIPILNVIGLTGYLMFRTLCEDGEDKNPYYCKSAFTKKY